MYLSKMNILPLKSTLDDVLALNTESILSRRLQTLTYLKGLANTPYQSRQLISHGHIAIGDRRVTVPGYLVTKDEEGEIGYTSDSPLNDTMHPARPKADFKSIPFKREEKPIEPTEESKEEKHTKEKSEKPPLTEPVKDGSKTPTEEQKEKQAPAEKPDDVKTEEKPESTEKVEQEQSAEQPSVKQTPEPKVEKPQKEETKVEKPSKEETSNKPEAKPEKESKKEEKPKEEQKEDKGGK
jgi:ribosomal protein S4